MRPEEEKREQKHSIHTENDCTILLAKRWDEIEHNSQQSKRKRRKPYLTSLLLTNQSCSNRDCHTIVADTQTFNMGVRGNTLKDIAGFNFFNLHGDFGYLACHKRHGHVKPKPKKKLKNNCPKAGKISLT